LASSSSFTFVTGMRARTPAFARSLVLACALAAGLGTPQRAWAQGGSPSVLVVTAHPDDDAMFAAAVYRITHGLGGVVDLALITDGSGGFRYSGPAEAIYHLHLTDEDVARQYLPAIRKRELLAGGAIVGIRKFFFLDELDNAYTENIDTILTYVWRTERVTEKLRQIMADGAYDFVFTHLPRVAFHAHHKAATILALRAAAALPGGQRPIVLGSFLGGKNDTTLTGFVEHPGYPITRVRPGGPHFFFDKTRPLDETGRLNYHIVVNWLIAEHKSQGTMQLLMNTGDVERFWYFAANGPARFEEAAALFEAMNRRP
jgi:LmbE family N-acetylglucosaminyl deacetylase